MALVKKLGIYVGQLGKKLMIQMNRMVDLIEFKSIFRRFFHTNEFKKNIWLIFSGNASAQIIPILLAPINARLYAPADYGVLAIFLAFSSIINILSNLNFPLAIFIPKDDEDATSILRFSILISLLVGALLFIILIITQISGIDLAGSELYKWFFLLPLVSVLYGINFATSSYLGRLKKYNVLSNSRLVASVFSSLLTVVIGYYFMGPAGLFLGFIINYLIIFLICANALRKYVPIVNWGSVFKLEIFSKYKSFPLYSFPSDLILLTVFQLPVFFFGKINQTLSGYLGMSNRLLGLPTSLISTSLGEVFRQGASESTRSGVNSHQLYRRTLKFLLLVSFIPFLLFFLSAPQLFKFVFGDQWASAGEYARILSVPFYARFLSQPFLSLYFLHHRQKEEFLIHVYLLISTLGLLVYFAVVRNEIFTALIAYSLNYAVVHMIYLLRTYHFSKHIKFE